jgi:hypothetical protein
MPYGTSIAKRRLAKDRLYRMLEFKSLYTISDMVNYFGKLEPTEIDEVMLEKIEKNGGSDILKKSPKSFNNFALISSSNPDFFEENSEETEDILTHILSSVGHKLKRNKDDKKVSIKTDLAKKKVSKRKRNIGKLINKTEKKNYFEFDFSENEVMNNRGDMQILNCEPILSGKSLYILDLELT